MNGRWTSTADAVLDQACETGELPDGRIATQERLACTLGFSRQTICAKLGGRQLSKSIELKREGGLSSAHRRAMIRAQTMRQSSKARKVRHDD